MYLAYRNYLPGTAPRSQARIYAGGVQDPPPLPPASTRVSTVVGVGTAVWSLAALALLAAHLIGGRPLDTWFATCVAGALLGAVGWGIFSWQRAAVRRGSRGAQTGLD